MLSYYTFEGSIEKISDDAGAVAIAGLSVNDPICYVFLINREQSAIRIKNDGSIHTYNDDRNKTYFFADLVSGSMIHEVDEGSINSPSATARFNRGFESRNHFDLLVGSGDHFINVRGTSRVKWEIGTTLKAIEAAYDKHKKSSVCFSHLSLTSISDANSVPAPHILHHKVFRAWSF